MRKEAEAGSRSRSHAANEAPEQVEDSVQNEPFAPSSSPSRRQLLRRAGLLGVGVAAMTTIGGVEIAAAAGADTGGDASSPNAPSDPGGKPPTFGPVVVKPGDGRY